MSCTVDQLIDKCKQALKENWQYVYGAKGTILSRAQIDNLRNLYGANCVWWSDSNKAGHKCCDCSGLITTATGVTRGSAQYKSTAVECYPISQREPRMRGWAVWMKGHIGVYDGNGGYYAMDGSARNMVHYPLSKNKFTHIIKLCDVDYGDGVSTGKVPDAVASGGSYNALVNFTYSVRTEDGAASQEVSNLSGFAGVRGKRITDIAIKCDKGSCWYQVHILGNAPEDWLSKVSGYDWNDSENGFAGDNKPIDAVRVYYNTPHDIVSKHGYQQAQYRVSPVNQGYYDWQYDDEVDARQDGYAGCFGKAIDRFQLF
ncbi:MAG: hypothetical protein HFG83_05425 [Dorea sp.]|nr:hypothetical protein [Dorea sp.]